MEKSPRNWNACRWPAASIELGERPLLPARLHFAFSRRQELRYGENPHQRAALYVPAGYGAPGLAAARQLQGKELSYNNLVDLEAASELAMEFRRPAAVIVKHNNPCGTAEQETLVEAYRERAGVRSGLRVRRRDGVQSPARRRDRCGSREAVRRVHRRAGLRTGGAGKIRGQEKSAAAADPRVGHRSRGIELELKRISGGVLVQEQDRHELAEGDLKVVTRRAPTREEIEAMLFGWKVCKHVKSNAIVFARAGQTVGVGAGQMSRVDSVKIAVMKAQLPLAGSVVAPTHFSRFPMASRKRERPARRP